MINAHRVDSNNTTGKLFEAVGVTVSVGYGIYDRTVTCGVR